MKLAHSLALVLALSVSGSAQIASKGLSGPGVWFEQGTAQTSANVLSFTRSGPSARYFGVQVADAQGPSFMVLASVGEFDPTRAYVVGTGQLDAAGNGEFYRYIAPAPLRPELSIEVAVVYTQGPRTFVTEPTRVWLSQPPVEEFLDFDFAPGDPDPAKGQVMAEEYAVAGIHISATNNVPGRTGAAIIFDGADPSGEDPDLVTPKGDKVLIIAEDLVDDDSDGFVDDPDDEQFGGSLIFDFDDPVEVRSLTVIDIDLDETAFAQFTHSDNSTTNQPFAALGDGIVQTISFTETDVVKMELVFSGSGGLVGASLLPCPYVVNFDSRTLGLPMDLKPGEEITNQFADLGLTISGVNNEPTHPQKLILFDSENPTGGDDDLITPGYGFNNDTPLGNVLIIAENDIDADMDGYVDDPDDEAAGGQMIFEFDEDVALYGFTILDVDGTEEDFFEAFAEGGGLLATQAIPSFGDNSVIEFLVEPPLTDVRTVVLNLDGSGAVTQLRFCPEGRTVTK